MLELRNTVLLLREYACQSNSVLPGDTKSILVWSSFVDEGGHEGETNRERERQRQLNCVCVCVCVCMGHAVAQLVEALRYKPEGRGFDSRWCH